MSVKWTKNPKTGLWEEDQTAANEAAEWDKFIKSSYASAAAKDIYSVNQAMPKAVKSFENERYALGGGNALKNDNTLFNLKFAKEYSPIAQKSLEEGRNYLDMSDEDFQTYIEASKTDSNLAKELLPYVIARTGGLSSIDMTGMPRAQQRELGYMDNLYGFDMAPGQLSAAVPEDSGSKRTGVDTYQDLHSKQMAYSKKQAEKDLKVLDARFNALYANPGMQFDSKSDSKFYDAASRLSDYYGVDMSIMPADFSGDWSKRMLEKYDVDTESLRSIVPEYDDYAKYDQAHAHKAKQDEMAAAKGLQLKGEASVLEDASEDIEGYADKSQYIPGEAYWHPSHADYNILVGNSMPEEGDYLSAADRQARVKYSFLNDYIAASAALSKNPEDEAARTKLSEMDEVANNVPYLRTLDLRALPYMDDSQRETFYRYYNNNDFAAVDDYLGKINYDIAKKAFEAEKTAHEADLADNTFGENVLNYITAFPRNLIASWAQNAYLANQWLNAFGIEVGDQDYIHEYNELFKTGQEVDMDRAALGQQITDATSGLTIPENIPVIGGKNIANMGYQALTSLGDLWLSRKLGGNRFTSASMFGREGGDTVREAQIAGNPNALLYGTGAGAWSALVEYFGRDELAASNAWKAATGEGREEVITGVGQNVWDLIVNRENSGLIKTFDEYVRKGYADHAKWATAEDTASDLVEQYAVGFGAGGAPAAVNATVQGIENRKRGENLRNNEALEEVINLAETLPMSDKSKGIIERMKAERAEQAKNEKAQTEDKASVTKEDADAFVQEAEKNAEQNARDRAERADETKEQVQEDPAAITKEDAEAVKRESEQNARDRAERADEGKPGETVDPAAITKEDAEAAKNREQAAQARKAAAKQNAVKNAEIGYVYREMMQHLDEGAKSVVTKTFSRSTIEGELEAEGYEGNTIEAAQIIAKFISGDNGRGVVKAIEGNAAMRKVALGFMEAVDFVRDAYYTRAGEISKRASKDYVKPEATEGAKDEAAIDDRAAITDEDIGLELADTPESTVDGKAVTIEGVAKVAEDGSVTYNVKDADGNVSEVAATDITYGQNDGDVARLVAMAKDLGRNAETLIKSYAEGQNVYEYAAAFKQAMQYGEDGRNIDVVKGYSDMQSLNEGQIAAAYELGRGIRTQRNNAMVRKNVSGIKVGQVDTSGVDFKSLTKHQRTAMHTMSRFATVAGFNIKFVESKANAEGKYTTENGSWDPETLTLTLDVHAGSNKKSDVNYAMMHTAGHELTHFIRQFADTDLWNAYQEFVIGHLSKKGEGVYDLESRIEKQIENARKKGRSLTRDGAIEEIIANASGEALNSITEADIQALAETNPSLLNKIKQFFQKWIKSIKTAIKAAYSDTEAKTAEAKLMMDAVDEMGKRWNEMLVNAVKNKAVASEATIEGVELSESGETAYAGTDLLYDLRTFNESDYVTERDKAAAALAKKMGITAEKAEAYIDDVTSIAAMVAADRDRLDFEAENEYTALKHNSEYKFTVDFSTLCKKRLLYTGTFDAIQKQMPETALTEDDYIRLRQMMADRGYEVACAFCYVESRRKNNGEIINKFLDVYKEAQKTGGQMELGPSNRRKAFKVEDGFTPNIADFNTSEGIANIMHNHRDVYDAYMYFMNARGVSKPKLIESRTAYSSEILKKFKSASAVKAMNRRGGLRLQSFSDFEVVNMLDMMQVVMDMSRVGLMSQAYTKVPAFARVFGGTGVKINLSLVTKGVDKNGKLIFDDIEGMPHEEAFKIRNMYSEHVGTILVGKDDATIKAAMADPRIDFIIPYHASGWSTENQNALGIGGYTNFTAGQNETNAATGKGVKNFQPSEYWDYSKTGDENAQIYLEKCREAGRVPKFPQYQNYPGYWKMLIDFKMYDNEGNGSPQRAVRPDYNLSEANRIMNEYTGGHQNLPVAHDVVRDFVKEYEGKGGEATFYDDGKKYSERVDDEETLDFLNNQETVTTYKTMQLVDGKLYPPMAAVVAGKYEDASELGAWEATVEHPELIKWGDDGKAYFKLDKGQKRGSLDARYNPYMHSSNLVLNDQFTGAYARDNLVTVQCEVPVSELNSGYHAEHAKDPVGWHPWHAGPVAGTLRNVTGTERQVLLSRWIKPVRIVPDSEVAAMYKELLDGTGITVPENVVPPGLKAELEKAGVPIATKEEAKKLNDALKKGKKSKSDIKYDDRLGDDYDLNDSELARFYAKLGEIKAGKKAQFIRSRTGDYIFEIDNRLVYNNGNYYHPMINEVLTIYLADETDVAVVRRLIYGAEERKWSYEQARRTFEGMFGPGVVDRYDDLIRRSDAWEARHGKRKARGNVLGRIADQQSEEPVDKLYQDRDYDEISDRELLVRALETELTPAERDHLERYKKKVEGLGADQTRMEELTSRIVELRKAGHTARTSEELRAAETNVATLRKRIDRKDKELKGIESADMIREIVRRNRAEARKQAYALARQRADKRQREAVEHAREVGERRVQRMKESQAKEKYKKRILEDSKKLMTWATSPTAKDHVPQFMRRPLLDFFEAINFSSNRALKGGEETNADKALMSALDALRRSVEENEKGLAGFDDGVSEFVEFIDLPEGFANSIDELVYDFKKGEYKTVHKKGFAENITDIKGAFGELASMDNDGITLANVALNHMTSAQLKRLAEITTTLRTSIRNINVNLANSRFASNKEMSKDGIDEMNGMKAKMKTNKALEVLNSTFNWKNATPFMAFQRLGRAGKAVFEALQDGWDKMARNSAKLIQYAKDTFNEKESKAWSSEITEVTLDSKDTIQMTTAQKMSLYCHTKREQSRGHLMGGGIRVSDIAGKRGTKITQAENYVLTEADIERIIDSLTARQIEVADALQAFMNGQCAEWGNEISMKRFGYEQMTEKHYFPIKTDSNNRASIDESKDGSTSMFRLLNMSSLKPLTPGANNAIIIEDIFNVFSDHASDMAKYNALALPILDFIKWYNFVEKSAVVGADGKPTGQHTTRSTRKALERVFGKNADDYLRAFIKDLNAEHDGGRNDGLINSIVGRAKSAAVGANLRVYGLQITSLPRAAYAIDAKYLIKGMAKWKSLNPVNAKNGTEAQDEVGILLWKKLGFFSTDTSRSVREMVKRDKGFFGKLRDAQMEPAGWGDNWVSNIIYEAAKAELADKHKDLKPGTDAYKKALNDRVREIVYKTQVVDSTMTRSDLMRSKGLASMTTAFMSEPTLTINMLNESIQKAVETGRKGGNARDILRATGGMAVRAAVTWTVTSFITAMVESAFDGLRDDDEYETFLEKFNAAFKGNMVDNLNPITMLPILNEAWSILVEGYEDSSLMTQVLSQGKSFMDAIKSYKKGNTTLYNVIYKGAQTTSSMGGVGVSNAMRDFTGLYNTFLAPAWDTPKLQTYEDSESTAAEAYYNAVTEGRTEDAEYYMDRMQVNDLDMEKVNKKLVSLAGDGFVAGNVSEADARKWLNDAGYTKDKTEDKIRDMQFKKETGVNYSDFKSAYVDGTFSKTEATRLLKKYRGYDDNKVYFTLQEWDGGEDWTKYGAFLDAVDNRSGYAAEAKKLLDHGVEKGDIASAIAKAYKEAYREIHGTQAGNLMLEYLLDVYEAIGYDRDYERKYITKNWIK